MYLSKYLVGLFAATAGVAAMPAPTPAAIYDIVERAPEPSLEARQGDGCSFQTFVVHVILEMHQANETQHYFRCKSYKHHNRLCLRCTCFEAHVSSLSYQALRHVLGYLPSGRVPSLAIYLLDQQD